MNKLEVTAQDIQNALDHKKLGGFAPSIHCPIGRAFSREKKVVIVTPTRLNFSDRLVNLPKIAKEFIRYFDAGKEVHPFEFEY